MNFKIPELAERLQALTRSWAASPPFDQALGFVVLDHLHLTNFRLWQAEDVARQPQLSDAELGQVKRRIDQLNCARNKLIATADDIVWSCHCNNDPQAPTNTETFGSAIDRLSVLTLRCHFLEQRGDERLPAAQQQHADLVQALLQLQEDLVHGRKRQPCYGLLKSYGA